MPRGESEPSTAGTGGSSKLEPEGERAAVEESGNLLEEAMTGEPGNSVMVQLKNPWVVSRAEPYSIHSAVPLTNYYRTKWTRDNS